MATDGKIRVGIVGASASRGFASIAHIPGLRALPQFEITAVCTTRQETAEAAARHYGARFAFSDPGGIGAALRNRPGHGQRQGSRSLSARSGRDRGREARL